MKVDVTDMKAYIEKIMSYELTSYEALVWLKEHYQGLSLHDLSLLTALIDQQRVCYLFEKEKALIFFTSLEED